jgi:predicted esterase
VSHLIPEGGGRYRLAPTHLVPEVDQLMLGFSIMPLLDPLLTFREAGQLKASTREIYRDLEGDEDFRAVGSVMGLTYTDLLGRESSNHAYLYVPPGLDRSKPAPVLVFLHGHGGNFKAYLWLLSKVADRLNFMVVAPTGGVGRWTIDETNTRVAAALAGAKRVVAVDSGQIHTIGLSNGGRAVSHLLASSRGDYHSFVFLSPVFREESVRALANATVHDNAFVFVITGVLDRRVPFSYVGDRSDGVSPLNADFGASDGTHAHGAGR